MKEQSNDANKFYVWFDTEYSSLDLETAWILQVAALIMDTSLRRVLPQEYDVQLTIRLPDGKIPSPWVEQNLPDLITACRSPEAVDIAEADNRLAAYVDAVAGFPAEFENKRPVLAGNSIHEDWWLVRRFLPRFLSRLNYRHLDVTAIKLEWKRLHNDEEFEKENPENIRRYFPEAVLPVSGNRHDAYYDLQASIAELAFYRCHLFRS
jgi:oligoribonuclease (3'-5' exoribonuclease)